ncbi:MAG: DUF3108 domain-containing protein [Proteobacteria bacterium]|nr:DUF3108 domain-containing protein [Pseudomonadota bacterium]
MRYLFIAACLLILPTPANASASLKPEQATYTVSRDGKAIGTATYSLAPNSDGSWTLRSQTRGTSGMAKLLGLDVREDSTFTLRDGKLQGLRYRYEQDATFKHKQRSVDFDTSTMQIHVRDNGKDFRYALVDGAIDRSAVAVALGLALADGATSVTLPVAVRDRIETQQFSAHAKTPIEVPAGKFDATQIDRTDTPGKVMKSWYAGGLLPIRVEQPQHDGAAIVMERK